MRFLRFAGLACAIAVASAQAPNITAYSDADIASGKAFQNISAIADANMKANIDQRTAAACTYESARTRPEWREMPAETRKAYTDAVTCLQKLPPQSMTKAQASKYPGVKSRHDEYVATHINYTYNIHATADFFAWHRTFVHFYYQDLQTLCNYTGEMPYWNWSLDCEAPEDSPVFSGDAYSMGSNGAYIANRTSTWLATQNVTYPPGTGGGCVKSGPFSNYTVNLGPLDLPNTKNVNSSFQYNPRCLVRDLNPWFSQNYNTWDNVTRLILEEIYVGGFQSLAQGYGFVSNKFGVHGGGHWQTGGSMSDFHSSPSDPLFFLHHGMMDYVWTLWQNLDIYRRQNIILGTSTIMNSPPSAEMTLNDMIPFGFVAPDQRFGDLMDTFAGPFCYRYV